MSRMLGVMLSGALFAVGLSVLTSCAVAEEIKVGAKAPDWSGIIGTDDQKHSLADYKDAKIIVLAFMANHCPVAVAYEDRLVAIQRDYKEKGVQVVAVNVNNIPKDRLDKMKIRAKEKGFNFPYLYDSSQKIGRDYGAAVTPHIFVLDQERKVAYVGSIDDNMKEKEVKQHYLRDALNALLTGKAPPVPHSKAFGCSIKYE